MPLSDRRVRPVEVRALEPYRIWLRYDDGGEGDVDLSHLAGRRLFASWQDPSFFSGVRLDPGGFVVWSDDIDLCGDALYLKLTGMSPEERFPSLAGQ